MGQTVYIYISTGPDVVMEPMPNVVGMELDRVKELMDQLGFTKVRYEPMESQKPKNEVIYQSVAKDTKTDVTSEIIIHYSEGPKETTAPTENTQETTESTTAPTTEETEITISFKVPERDKEYRLEVRPKGSGEVVASKLVPPGVASTYVNLKGTGTQSFDLYADGEYIRTESVPFS